MIYELSRTNFIRRFVGDHFFVKKDDISIQNAYLAYHSVVRDKLIT